MWRCNTHIVRNVNPLKGISRWRSEQLKNHEKWAINKRVEISEKPVYKNVYTFWLAIFIRNWCLTISELKEWIKGMFAEWELKKLHTFFTLLKNKPVINFIFCQVSQERLFSCSSNKKGKEINRKSNIRYPWAICSRWIAPNELMSALKEYTNEMYINNYKKLNFKGMSLDFFRVKNNTS